MTIDQIFEKFSTNADLGRAIGRNPMRATEMRKRGVIHIRYWKKLIRYAKEHGIEGITADSLLDAHYPHE